MATGERYASTQAVVAEQIGGLRVHLRRILKDDEDAQDIAQEACLKLLQAEYPDEIENPKAYLYTIAHNLLYHHYSSRRASITLAIDPDSLKSTATSMEEQTLLDVRLSLIQKAMLQLPTKCQTALVLRWRYGLCIAEIADHMHLSRAMVKKYLANGLAHFKKRLHRFALADQVAE